MKLPFTHDQFLDVFAAYNRLFWPVAVLLWLGSLAALVSWWRNGPSSSPMLSGLLALHWAWSGIAYHLAFFRAINPAAVVFAALFVAQAVLFAWRGVVHRTLVFGPVRSGWATLGIALAAYALLYPAIGLLTGLSYPRSPTFGVPCPTAILTAGLLLTAPRAELRLAAVVPVLWSAIGGSAAFLLGIRPDFALPVAGVALLVHASAPRPAPRSRA